MEGTVKERLKLYLKTKKIKQKAFAASIGLTPQAISSMRRGFADDKVPRIKELYPDLNIEWLLYGLGDMLNDEKGPEVLSSGERAVYEKIIQDRDRQIAELQAQLLDAMRRLDAAKLG